MSTLSTPASRAALERAFYRMLGRCTHATDDMEERRSWWAGYTAALQDTDAAERGEVLAPVVLLPVVAGGAR